MCNIITLLKMLTPDFDTNDRNPSRTLDYPKITVRLSICTIQLNNLFITIATNFKENPHTYTESFEKVISIILFWQDIMLCSPEK